MKYNPQKIEKKWQRIWQEEDLYRAGPPSKRKKFYVLDMFPYPSGAGLHVGHIKGYIATDVVARMKMMQGYNVLHPMGWDAFGLPAENYAIKNKIHPDVAVKKNIRHFKKQLSKIGFTYDWSKEINTTDPEYYKWTQWAFLEMFKRGLVSESYEPINWCPKCKTGLANEDIQDGRCERCGTKVVKKPIRQWVIKITKYADRLLKGLKGLDWPEHIIKMQEDWIGRSEGTEFDMRVFSGKNDLGGIRVFTTRLDTVFGMTYVVLAPEHELIERLKENIGNFKEIKKYKKGVEAKLAEEREKEKKGIRLEGISAENPFNKERVPVFVSEYVLADYGTGAIMAVPAHDERDFEFARRYNLPIRRVIRGVGPAEEGKREGKDLPFVKDGVVVNSGSFSGLSSGEAREEMTRWLRRKKMGRKKVFYRIRDWVFARQRYWGEPFPLVYCPRCKERILRREYKKGEFNKGELANPGWVCLSEKDLPLKLPKVKYYEPTGTGESPLSNIKKWVKTSCPKCGGPAKRETNTMPQWAGSSWYYLRYTDAKNKKEPLSRKKELYWLPVDLYVGGAEHATRHLIYARFWHKFLKDIGVVSTAEPFLRLKSVGIILASDSRKMSKRYGNVVNPDDMSRKYGADSLRLYEMFMGPFGQEIAWQEKGVVGARRFLERVWKLASGKRKALAKNGEGGKEGRKKGAERDGLEGLIHKTIKKVTEDIEHFKFNTAISSLMILVKEMERQPSLETKDLKLLVQMLAPFAPHIAEEIWQGLVSRGGPRSFPSSSKNDTNLVSGEGGLSIFLSSWPKWKKELIREERFVLVVQVNGRVRERIEAGIGISQEEAREIALRSEKVRGWLRNKKIRKVIFVKNKLINFVV